MGQVVQLPRAWLRKLHASGMDLGISIGLRAHQLSAVLVCDACVAGWVAEFDY